MLLSVLCYSSSQVFTLRDPAWTLKCSDCSPLPPVSMLSSERSHCCLLTMEVIIASYANRLIYHRQWLVLHQRNTWSQPLYVKQQTALLSHVTLKHNEREHSKLFYPTSISQSQNTTTALLYSADTVMLLSQQIVKCLVGDVYRLMVND